MNTSNMIKAASESGWSKKNEVDILVQFAAEVDPHSYLASLVNGGLVEWFSMQTRMDASCDILHALEYAEDQGRAEANAEHERYEAALAETERLQKVAAKAEADAKGAQILWEGAVADAGQLRGDLSEEQIKVRELELRLERIEQLAAGAWLREGSVTPSELRAALRGSLDEQD